MSSTSPLQHLTVAFLHIIFVCDRSVQRVADRRDSERQYENGADENNVAQQRQFGFLSDRSFDRANQINAHADQKCDQDEQKEPVDDIHKLKALCLMTVYDFHFSSVSFTVIEGIVALPLEKLRVVDHGDLLRRFMREDDRIEGVAFDRGVEHPIRAEVIVLAPLIVGDDRNVKISVSRKDQQVVALRESLLVSELSSIRTRSSLSPTMRNSPSSTHLRLIDISLSTLRITSPAPIRKPAKPTVVAERMTLPAVIDPNRQVIPRSNPIERMKNATRAERRQANASPSAQNRALPSDRA